MEAAAIVCPDHNLQLERLEITQGDLLLGYIFVCPQNEWGTLDGDCEYCLDGDMQGNPIPEKWEQENFMTALDCEHVALHESEMDS